MAESDDAYDSAEDSNHGGGGGEDEVMEVMEDDKEVTQATKKAKIKANSKKSTQVYNAKKKEAISTHLGNIRILFVMAHTEFMPVNLFNQESGLGKIFKDTFDGDTKCQFDYLEVHEMVKFDKGDNREDLSSWWDDDWDTDELHTNGVTPFNFFELMEGEENHSVPATNHVLGCLFKHYMKETHQADVMVAFTKDSSVESAIQANGDRLAEFNDSTTQETVDVAATNALPLKQGAHALCHHLSTFIFESHHSCALKPRNCPIAPVRNPFRMSHCFLLI